MDRSLTAEHREGGGSDRRETAHLKNERFRQQRKFSSEGRKILSRSAAGGGKASRTR